MLVHGFFFFFIADPLWLLFFPFNLQAPEWFRHEQHNILAESGFGLGCGCSSGFCYLQSCCQIEITDKLERLSPPQPDAPSIKTKPLWPDAEPPQLELDKVHVILLFFLIPWRLPGHFPYLCHFHHLISSPLWSQLITSHQQQADDRIIPHAAGPSFFRLTLFVQAK